MTTRSDKLNRLAIGSECGASWDAMEGSASRRYCSECRREVLDFAQMSPQEIHARIEASRGRLCARLTWNAGRLTVLEPAEPPAPASPRAPRRASPIAATLVTAWLGVGAAEAQPAANSAPVASSPQKESPPGAEPGAESAQPAKSQPPRALVSALHGRVTDAEGAFLPGATVVARNALDGREQTTVTAADGRFSFAQLPAGVYDLKGELEGFDIEARTGISLQPAEDRPIDLTATTAAGEALTGVVAVLPDPLRRLFAESDLVVEARIGASVDGEKSGELTTVATELRIESLLKGSVSGRRVTLYHSEYLEVPDAVSLAAADFAPGTYVLAFLKASQKAPPGRGLPAFESADYDFGIKRLDAAGRAAYRGRLDALARLQRRAQRQGEIDAAERMEWLVATAEDPLTRGEATGEIDAAVEALAQLAEEGGTTPALAASHLRAVTESFRAGGGKVSEEPRPDALGASMTEKQKRRLTAALQKTVRLDDADVELFWLVRRWDEEAARTWLARRLRADKPPGGAPEGLGRLIRLAQKQDNEALRSLGDATEERQMEILERWPEDKSAATEKLRQMELAALQEELRRRFVEILAGSR